jgi:hypothetical protein
MTLQESFLKRQGNSSNFSSTYSPFARSLIIKEAQPLLKGHLKARELWNALQIADYKKEGVLNEAALQVLFQKQGQNLKELLQVSSSEELLSLLDEKGLGYLSEDEQVLMFSIIKERMQVCASELCKIYEYNLQKDLLKSIRALESDIILFQSSLRRRIHLKEINLYKSIGEEKLETFEETWKAKFEDFSEKAKEKVKKIQQLQSKQLKNLDYELSKDILALR